jgi:hypothetical protein
MTNDHIQHKPVGFRSPPMKHTFKKGHKGMGGRPPKNKSNPTPTTGSAELDRLIVEEADRLITVKENGKVTKVTCYEAAVRSLRNAAVKGHPASRRDFIRLTQEARQRQADARQALVDEAEHFKSYWTPIFADCARRGVAPPDILPHPDDVQILDGDRVVFNGPYDPLSKAWWDHGAAQLAQALEDRDVTMPRIREQRRLEGYFDEPGNQVDPEDDDPDRSGELIRALEIRYPTEAERRVPGFDLQQHRAKIMDVFSPETRKALKSRLRKRKASGQKRGPPPPLGPSLAQLFAAGQASRAKAEIDRRGPTGDPPGS